MTAEHPTGMTFYLRALCGTHFRYLRELKVIFVLRLRIVALFIFLLLNVCLFLGDRETALSGRGTEREGDTESEAGSRLRAVSTEPDMGSDPQTAIL